MKNKNNEIKTTAHSTYRCQYHIVFAPKFRRKEIYGKTVTTTKLKYTIKKLTSKKTYYIKVRAVIKSGNKTAYSKWSATKKVKIK